MSIHYKFKSALEYDTITFDGLHISVKDLKNSILQQKRIGKNSDFDLQVTNAQTKEVYADEDALIPKNTSLLIARVPLSVPNKGKSWEGYGAGDAGASARLDDGGPIGKAADLSSLDASEDEKIRAMISQSTQEYDPSNYLKVRGANQVGPVPQNYKCYKCHLGGHWIKDCPLGLSADSVEIKKSTGIPKSFMRQVAGPDVAGAMITPNGSYAVHCNTVDDGAPISGAQGTDGAGSNIPPLGPTFTTRADIPEDLLCSICDDLLVDAVMIPCCGNSFCDECVRNSLLESEDHECPDCHERDIAPTTLIPNRFLRKSVATFKNESGYVKKYREPRVVVPKKVEEQRPAPADSSTINNNPSENSGKTIISEADSTESAKLAAINDVPKREFKEEPEKSQPVAEEPPPANPSAIPAQEKLPKDVRPITNVATTYRENRQHARDRERNDNANARYRVPTGSYQRGDRSPGASQRSKYRRSPPRGGLVREERSDTPTIDEPGMTGLGPAPDPQRDYAPPPGTFMNPEPPPPRGPHGPPMQQLPPVMQQPPPGPMHMVQGPPQMQLPPPGMSVPPPGPYGGMPPQLGIPGVFSPGMPPNFRHPPPGAPPPIQTIYMPGPYNAPPRPIFDGSRGPPPLAQPPIGLGYLPNFAPRGRPGLPPRGIRVHTPPNVIDDPLEAFNRILREKDERRRRAQAQRRSYSRSRSSSRSYSRSPNRRGGGGGGSRSPRRRGSRSRSRSVRSGRSPVGRERSPRSFTMSRSRSRSRSLSPFAGGPSRDRDRERDYSPPPYHHYQHQPPHHHQHHGGGRGDHYPPHHHHHHPNHNSPPPYNKYGGPPPGHYAGGRGGTGRRGGSRYRSPPVPNMVGRNVSPPPPSRGYNNRGGGGFKDNAMDNRERHYDHYSSSSRDRDQRADRDVSNKPTMAELALGRADRYRNIDRDRDRDYGPPLSAAAAMSPPTPRDLRDNMRSDRDQAPMQRRSSRSPPPAAAARRFSPGSRHATVRSQPSPHHHQQQQQSDKRGRSKDRDRADNTRPDNRNERDGNKDRDRSRNDAPSSVGGGGAVVAGFYPPPAVMQSGGVVGVPVDGAVDYNRFGARQQVGQPTSHYPIAMDIVAPPGTTEQPLPPGEDPPPQQQQYQQYQLPIEPSGFLHMQHNQQPFVTQIVTVGATGHHNREKQFSSNEENSNRRGRYASDRNDRENRDKSGHSRTSSKDNYDSPDRRSNKTSRRLGRDDGSPVKSRKEREYSDDDRKNRKADKKKKKDKKEQDKKKKKDKKEGDKKDKKKNKEKLDLSDKEDKKDEVTNEKIVESVEKAVVEMEPSKEAVGEPEINEIPPQEVEPINDLYGDLINEEIVDTNIVQSYGKLPEIPAEVQQTNKPDDPPEEATAAIRKSKSPEQPSGKLDVSSTDDLEAECVPEESHVVEHEVEDNREMEMDVLELHSQDDVEEDKELLHLLPEKSKWETEAIEDTGVVDVKQEDAKAATKVSNEVLKRAENAIFAKAINAIRPPIEIKKISLDRAKLYSTKVEVDDFPRNVQVTLKNDHYEEPTESTAIAQSVTVDLSIQEQKAPPPAPQQQQQRLSVKERLGCKVDDLDRIIRIDMGRNRSKSGSVSPLRKKHVVDVQNRRFDVGRREEKMRYNSRDKDRIARSYRNAERSRSKDKKEDCRKKIQENRSRSRGKPAADKSLENRKKRRSRSRSRDKKKDSKRARKDRDKEKSSSAKTKDDSSAKKSSDQSKSVEMKKQQREEEKRQRSAEPAPPGTEDSSPPPILPPPPPPPPPRKVAIIEEKPRKSIIDEASFEPDYDLEESDDDKSKRSTTPQHHPPIHQQKSVKITKAPKEDESSSDSSTSGDRKKKKQHKKKSKKRRRRDSSSSSSESSSESEGDRERKRKKHRKKAKKAKKRKHKDR